MLKECKFPDSFNINKYNIPKLDKVNPLQDRDIIALGDRELKVIHTPGHSPGHICLYDVELTYNSNAIEGNALTITETKVILEEGLTIGRGKVINEFDLT